MPETYNQELAGDCRFDNLLQHVSFGADHQPLATTSRNDPKMEKKPKSLIVASNRTHQRRLIKKLTPVHISGNPTAPTAGIYRERREIKEVKGCWLIINSC